MLIIFKPEKQNPARRGSYRYDGFTLTPGTNNISQKDYQFLEAHPSFVRDMNLGAIAVMSEPEEVPPPLVSSLADVGEDKLPEVLATVYDVAQIDEWLAAEKRTKAIKMLNRRRSEIEKGV